MDQRQAVECQELSCLRPRANVFWVNLHKRGGTSAALGALERVINQNNVTHLLLQETQVRPGPSAIAITAMVPQSTSSDLSAYLAQGRQAELRFTTDYALALYSDGLVIINVHLSAYKSAVRTRQLTELDEYLLSLNSRSILIGGDFNLAPRDVDGVFDARPSTWTSAREREALARMMERHDLVDVLASPDGDEFTFDRVLRGGRCQFRCDILLSSRALLPDVTAKYMHETRLGSWAFTDHSGIMATLRKR